MKKKGQRDNRNPIETLALFSLGLRDGSRDSVLGRARRGFNSPQVHHILKVLPYAIAAASGERSSDMSQGQDWKPVSFLLCLREKARAKVMTCHNCKIECNKFGRDRKGCQPVTRIGRS